MCAISSHAIEFEGRPARLVLAHDITEQRRLEEQLRQAQKMEAIGSLAGGVAHDFNNILLVIRGYSALLLERLERRAAARQRRADRQRRRARGRAHAPAARVQPPAGAAAARSIDLNAVVDETLELLERLIGEDIELESQLEPKLEPILVDRGQLEQVILNLAVNARDAMPRRRHADDPDRQRRARRGLRGRARGRRRRARTSLLQVTDTGTGMDAETQSRVFEPFFTTKEERHRARAGDRLRDRQAERRPHLGLQRAGHGHDLQALLPDARAPTRRRPEPRGRGHRSTGDETILLVEDDEMVRAARRRRRSSRTATPCSPPRAAPKRSRSPSDDGASIDLLLTDVVMPRHERPRARRDARRRGPT